MHSDAFEHGSPDALVRAARDLGDAMLVLSLVARPDSLDPDPNVLLSQLDFLDHLALGYRDTDAQIEALSRATERADADPELTLALARRYVQANRLDAADRLFRELIVADSHFDRACSGLAETKRRWDDPEEIDEVWVFCANRANEPDRRSEYWFRAGVVRRDHGRLPEAVEAFRYARDAGGDSAELSVAMALTFEIAGQRETADLWYVRAADAGATNPHATEATLQRARLSIRDGTLETRERDRLERDLLSNSPTPSELEILGRLYAFEADLDGFRAVCDRLDTTAARLEYARLEWIAMRDPQRTRRTLEAIAIGPGYREAERVAAARIAVAIGDFDRAAELLSGSTPFDGGETASAFVDLWLARGEHDRAAQFAHDIEEHPTLRWTLWEVRFRLRAAWGQHRLAEGTLRHAVHALYPIDARNGDEWWRRKAYLLETSRPLIGHGDESGFERWLETELTTTAQRVPLDAELWDLLATTREHLGDREGALQARRVSARLLPERFAEAVVQPGRSSPTAIGSSRRFSI